MKKAYLIFAALILGISTVAQVTIVPRASLVLATWKWDDSDIQDEMNNKVGFSLGVGLNIPFKNNEALSFNPELYFITKGTKGTDFFEDFTGLSDETTATLNYIEVPALLRYSFSGSKVFIEAGPSLGFLLGGKVKVDGDGFDMDMKVKTGNFDDWLEEANSDSDDIEVDTGTDFGFQLGLGVKLEKVNLSIRYGIGLTEIVNSDNLDGAFKNRAWQFTVAFPIVK